MEPNKSIFVGGLPSKTQRSEVEKYFSKYGEVESCMLKKNLKTGRSLGFGTVTFKYEESSKKVLSSLPVEYQGRIIDVKPYWTKEGLAKNTEEEMKRKLFIGYLPKGTDNDHLKEHFQRDGKVVCAFVIKDLVTQEYRNYGYVIFETAEDLNNVMSTPTLRVMRANGYESEILLIRQTNKSEISRYKLLNSQVNGGVADRLLETKPTWNDHNVYRDRGKVDDRDRGWYENGNQYKRAAPFVPRGRILQPYEDYEDQEDRWQKRIPLKGNPAIHESKWISPKESERNALRTEAVVDRKAEPTDKSSVNTRPVEAPQWEKTASSGEQSKDPQRVSEGLKLQTQTRRERAPEERSKTRREKVQDIKKEILCASRLLDQKECNYFFRLQDPDFYPSYLDRAFKLLN